jgi:hypothetical protein
MATCVLCGNIVSRQARACQHCGSTSNTWGMTITRPFKTVFQILLGCIFLTFLGVPWELSLCLGGLFLAWVWWTLFSQPKKTKRSEKTERRPLTKAEHDRDADEADAEWEEKAKKKQRGIKLEKQSRPSVSQTSSTLKEMNRKPDFEKYIGKKLVIDGSNLVGQSEWQFQPLKGLLKELKSAKYEYIIFFDNGIYRALKEKNLMSKEQEIDLCLSEILEEAAKSVIVAPAGKEADPFILEYAFRKMLQFYQTTNLGILRIPTQTLLVKGC